jgi:hypothetical protein
MMINSLALFPNSIDPELLSNLLSRQIESLKKARGLLSIKMSEGNLMSPGGPPSFGKVLETSWDSLESFMTWVQNQTPSEDADKDLLLENGAVLLFYEVIDLN